MSRLQQKAEILKTVTEHLLAQGKRAMSHYYGCSYLGDDGSKCAVGCLIKDEFYDRRLEGQKITDPHVMHALEASGIDMHNSNLIVLLEQLQHIHDCHEPSEWGHLLQELECTIS